MRDAGAVIGGDTAVRIPVRTGGPALVIAGALTVFAVLPHPNIFRGSLGGTVSTTSLWIAIHAAGFVSAICGWWGMVCLVAFHRSRLGRGGDLALAATTVGAFLLAAVMFTEAVAFPAVARHAPDLLALDGPMLGPLAFRAAVAPAGLYFGGGTAIGVIVARRGTLRAAGWSLAAATVVFSVGAGLFVPVLSQLSAVALCAVLVWWGWLLGRATNDRPAEPQPASG